MLQNVMAKHSVARSIRFPDFKPRGKEKFPHWHDCHAWARKTTMTRSRFLAMTKDEFADWASSRTEDVMAFFYANRHPEGWAYAESRGWLRDTCHEGLVRHPHNWHPLLRDVEA